MIALLLWSINQTKMQVSRLQIADILAKGTWIRKKNAIAEQFWMAYIYFL